MAGITGHSMENSLLMKINIKNSCFFFLKRFLKQIRYYLPHKCLEKYVTFLLLDFPDSSAYEESTCIAGDLVLIPGSGRSTREGLGYALQYSWASLRAHLIKKSACSMEDLSSIPGLARSPGEGKGYPLQYSGLENSMDCILHEVTKSRTWLSNFHFVSCC